MKNQHKISRWDRDDVSIVGYRCSCGGWWKVYQNPYHMTEQNKQNYDKFIKSWPK
jgi:hypothetical protein